MKADVIASQICCHHCTNTEYRQKCPRRVWGRPEIKTALPVLGAGGECPMMRFKEATREAGREYRCISKGDIAVFCINCNWGGTNGTKECWNCPANILKRRLFSQRGA